MINTNSVGCGLQRRAQHVGSGVRSAAGRLVHREGAELRSVHLDAVRAGVSGLLHGPDQTGDVQLALAG